MQRFLINLGMAALVATTIAACSSSTPTEETKSDSSKSDAKTELVKTDSGAANTVDLRPCIVTTYMPELPLDPTTGTETGGFATYYTGYTVQKDATTQRITVCAPGFSEAAISNPAPAPFCVTR